MPKYDGLLSIFFFFIFENVRNLRQLFIMLFLLSQYACFTDITKDVDGDTWFKLSHPSSPSIYSTTSVHNSPSLTL